MIDGEAVLLGDDGISDFNGLHSRKYDDEVTLYAFDFLISEGEDVRKLPLSMRKTSLARLLTSSYPTSSKARSVRTCSATPA